MTSLRLAGSVLICMACVIFCTDRRRRLRDHIDALDTVCRFIAHTRREIEYYSAPFPQIIDSFDDPHFTADSVSSVPESLPLDPDERAELAKFLDSVGRGYPDAEIRLCTASLEVMTDHLERAKADFPRRAKTETSLALLVGASAAILII